MGGQAKRKDLGQEGGAAFPNMGNTEPGPMMQRDRGTSCKRRKGKRLERKERGEEDCY